MSLATGLLLIFTAFATATLSGVFGIAGGLVLMGVLALVLPVSASFVTHGLLQTVANGWRAFLHRRHVDWKIVGLYALGSLTAGIIVTLVAYAPSKPVLYLLMGLVPGLVWIPRSILKLDAARPVQAFACGLSVTALNLTAGVAGPLLDIFFVRTEMTRHRIVATKAATQVLSHMSKVVVYGGILFAGAGKSGIPRLWVFAFAIPLSMVGTVIGGRILDRLTDKNFIRMTRLIVTAVGVIYLIQAAQLFARGAG